MNRPNSTTLALLLLTLCTVDVHAQGALERLENALDGILAPREAGEPRSEPGFLGLLADDAPDGVRGVTVLSVNKGGPAEAAGLRAGDVITAIGGRPVNDLGGMAAAISGRTAGESLEFTITRDAKSNKIGVTLGRRPRDGGAERSGGARVGSVPEPAAVPGTGRPTLGVTVHPVTDETRIRFGLTIRRGALVTAVKPDSPAASAGFKAGDVIVEVAGRRIDSPDDLTATIRIALPGQEIEITYYEGKRLLRRTVRLSRSTASVEPARPRERIFGEDRPTLRRIEGIIDRFVPPPGAPAEPERRTEIEQLRRQVELMQRQMEQMQRRIAELESKLDG